MLNFKMNVFTQTTLFAVFMTLFFASETLTAFSGWKLGIIPIKEVNYSKGGFGLIVVPPEGIDHDFIEVASKISNKSLAYKIANELSSKFYERWDSSVNPKKVDELVQEFLKIKQRIPVELQSSLLEDVKAPHSDLPIFHGLARLSMQSAGVVMSPLLKNSNSQIQSKHALLTKPKKNLSDFKPQTGFFKGPDGQTWVRVLVDRSENETVYAIGDFNDWGECSKQEKEKYKLQPDPKDFRYYQGPIPGLTHLDQYLFEVHYSDSDIRKLLDPSASAYSTLEFNENMYEESLPLNRREAWKNRKNETALNSVYWDFSNNKNHLETIYDANHLISSLQKPLVIAEAELRGLIGALKEKPKSKFQTYRFIAQSGIIKRLKKMGYNAIELLPLIQALDGDAWQVRYLGYGLFSTDTRYGTPDDFIEMVKAFHDEGIMVIEDFLLSHFATGPTEHTDPNGNLGASLRDIESRGIMNWLKLDGRPLYGGVPTNWQSRRYDEMNRYLVRYQTDALILRMQRYGISGFRIDNVDGMIFDTFDGISGNYGGWQALETIFGAVYQYFPGAFITAESFSGIGEILHACEASGLGAAAANDGHAYETIQGFFAGSRDWRYDRASLEWMLDHFFDRESILCGIAAKIKYFTNHDEAANPRDKVNTGKYPMSLMHHGDALTKKRRYRNLFAWMHFLGPRFMDMPQVRFMQEQSFSLNQNIEWDAVEKDADVRKMYEYTSALSNLYKNNFAFSFHNYHHKMKHWVHQDMGVYVVRFHNFLKNEDVYVVHHFDSETKTQLSFPLASDGKLEVLFDPNDYLFEGEESEGEISVSVSDETDESANGKKVTIGNLPANSTLLFKVKV